MSYSDHERGIGVSHLFFADDVLLFGQANRKHVQVMAKVLKYFCEVSGMRVNLEKSRMFCSKTVGSQIQQELSSILAIQRASNLGK